MPLFFRRRARWVVGLPSALALLGLAAGSVIRARALGDSTFDLPLETQTVDLGPSPYRGSDAVRVLLTCFRYSTFVVKQIDAGAKGAERLAIVPLGRGPVPPCTDKIGKGEIEIRDWGYFKGAKGTLVFFDADDGYLGGVPFGVFDARTGAQLFEDSAADDGPSAEGPIGTARSRNLLVGRDGHGTIQLTYRRAVTVECDLRVGGPDCWNRIKSKLGLPQSRPPACEGYGTPSGLGFECDLAYPVVVTLSPRPNMRAVDGKITCQSIY